MNKFRLILTFAVLGSFLLVATTPAAANSPVTGEGYLEYFANIVDMRTADGNTFMDTTENTVWYGTLSGTSFDVGKVVIHPSGNWNYRAIGDFTGTVDGKSGTLQMLLVGSRPDAISEWQGTWVILSGTGELEDLHGQGTFWGLGYTGNPPDVPGRIDYAGITHFDP